MTRIGPLLWLVLPMLMPSIAAIGFKPAAFTAAPLLTGVAAGMSGAVAVATGTPVLASFGVIIVLANTGTAIRLRSQRPRRKRSTRTDVAAAVIVLIVCALPLAGLARPIIDWDAHSSWLFRAQWFYGGGSFVRSATTNHAFWFAAGDYPPLIPATVGAFWRLVGRIDLLSGQTIIALLNYAGVTTVALAFPSLAPPRLKIAAGLLGALVGLAAFGFAGPGGTNGYADLLWAGGAVAGVLYLLRAPPTPTNIAVGALGAVAAGLTKNEGTITAVVILALALLRHRSTRTNTAVCASALALVVIWPVEIRMFGASSGLVERGNFARVLHGDPHVWARVGPTLTALAPLCVAILAVAFCYTIACEVGLGGVRRRLAVSRPPWTWAVVTTYGLLLIAAALSAREPIRQYLGSVMAVGVNLPANTTIARAALMIRLCVMSEIALCALYTLVSTSERRKQNSPEPMMSP